MNRATLLAILFSLIASVAAAQGSPLHLTLKEAIRTAIEKNLDLKAEMYTPAQYEADIRKNRAIYEPHLTLDTSILDARNYSPSSSSDYSQDVFSISPGAFQLLPTGGLLGLSYENTRQRSGSLAFSPSWTSSLSLSFTQPLLKNFGRETTELAISVSEMSKDGSFSHLQVKILDLVAQVCSEYDKLGSSRQNLDSRRVSLDLAKKILAETEARVKAGVMPAMEILNAQYGVSAREKDLIDAEKAVRDQVDVIAQLLQLGTVEEIVPDDPPKRTAYQVTEADAVGRAMALRPELQELQSQVAIAALQTKVARQQTLPSLNLVTGVGLTGVGTRYGRSADRLGSLDYPFWNVGLQLDVPIGNESARNDYVKSRLKGEQLQTQLESLKSQLASEVRIAIRSVESAYKQLDVAERARLYADERLKAYIKKSEVGLATNKDVLDVENDLAAARANQISSRFTYATALRQLWRSTGELLEKEGVTVDTAKPAALYEGAR